MPYMDLSFAKKASFNMEDLRNIMAILRSENGCPWDTEQTHKSIRNNLIEETYEAVEAIDNDDSVLLKEELGDIMLQVVFHSRISEEAGDFTFDDVISGICKKLIVRHPHIFADSQVSDSEAVLDQWEAIKRREKHQETVLETLRSVPIQFPALMRSQKLLKRAEKAGLKPDSVQEAIDDAQRRLNALKDAVVCGDKDAEARRMGELLFSLCAVSRAMRHDAEECLAFMSERFIKAFETLEALLTEREMNVDALPKAELCQMLQSALEELS